MKVAILPRESHVRVVFHWQRVGGMRQGRKKIANNEMVSEIRWVKRKRKGGKKKEVIRPVFVRAKQKYQVYRLKVVKCQTNEC